MGNAQKGFEIVAKFNRKSVMADAVRVYWENGYTYWQDFPGEYLLMVNDAEGCKVRLYYRGNAIETRY